MRGFNLSFKPKFITLLIFLSILGVNFSIYWSSFDYYLVEEDPKVVKPESINSLIKHFYTRDWFYYRPLLQVIWSFEWRLFKNEMFYYHMVNFILDFINIYLVYRIGLLLFKDRKISYLAAIIFAFHPTHAEDLTWVSPLVDLVVTFFYFSGFIYFCKYLFGDRERMRNYIFAFFLYVLALLSKEMAFTFPVLIFVFDFIYQPRDFLSKPGIMRRILVYLPYLILTLVYFTFRLSSESGGVSTVPPFNLKFFITNTLEGVRMLTLPAGILALFLIFVVFLLSFNRIYFFSFLLVFITLIPVIPSVMKERYLYLPSLGTSLMAGFIFVKIFFVKKDSILNMFERLRHGIGYLLLVLLVLFSSFSINERMLDVKGRADQSRLIPKSLKNYYPEFPEGSEIYVTFLPNYYIVPEELQFVDIEFGTYFEYHWQDMKLGLLSDFFSKYSTEPLPRVDKLYFFQFKDSSIIELVDFKERIYIREKLYRDCRRGKVDDVTFKFSEEEREKVLIFGDVSYSYDDEGLKVVKESGEAELMIGIKDIDIDPHKINNVSIYLSATDDESMAFPLTLIWNNERLDKEYYETINVFPDATLRGYKIDTGYNYTWIMSKDIESINLIFGRTPETVKLEKIDFSCRKFPYKKKMQNLDIFNP